MQFDQRKLCQNLGCIINGTNASVLAGKQNKKMALIGIKFGAFCCSGTVTK